MDAGVVVVQRGGKQWDDGATKVKEEQKPIYLRNNGSKKESGMD